MRRRGSRRASAIAAAACCLIVIAACDREPADQGPVTVSTVLRRGVEVQWPVAIGPVVAAEQACKEGYCLPGDALALTFGRAARWIVQFSDEPRPDAAIGLSQIQRLVDNDDLRRASDAARAVSDRSPDDPQRRLWLPDFRSAAEHTSRWTIPGAAGRVDSSLVISEALHCSENGWRAETTAYVCGAMRDGGGGETARGLWALTIARANGCLGDPASDCAGELQKELAKAQPAKLEAPAVLDIDLYAERMLMLLLSGYDNAGLHAWGRSLVALQLADGSWGTIADEEPHRRYRATVVSTWALAEWLRYLAEHRGEVPLLGALKLQAPPLAGGPAFWGCALPTGRE